MTLLRRHLTPSIAIALAAGLYACGGDKLTLPGEGQPTKIEAVTGNAQAGVAGTVLPLPLVVKVSDELGRPVSGQRVEYTVTAGGGQVSPSTFQTGADGRASVMWTLGPNAGDQGVQAQAVGGGAPDNLTQAFTATAIAGSGTLIAAVSGDDQSAPVSSALGQPLVVRVSDGNGNPVGGITIQWTVQNGGSISPETVVTGDDGLATASRVLGPTAGRQTAQASGDALTGSPVTFVQTAVASNPTALAEVSGNGQTAPAGFEVAQDLVVRLTDGNGNGVGGQSISWVVATGAGTVNPATSTTDPTGLARTRWTLGGTAGGNTLNAVFSGLPAVTFSATGSADVPTTLAISSGDNQSAAAGAALPAPLVVKVTDANNNPVANVAVTWTALDGGSVPNGTSATNAQGIAQTTRTLGLMLGTYRTTAAVDGLTGSPVTFTSTATVGAAAKIVLITPPSATAVNGVLFATQPVVQVQDAAGNNIAQAGRVITASILNPPPGSPLKGDLSKDTDANGQAAFTDLSIVGPVQTYTLRFRSGALAEARADVVVTVGNPASITAQPGGNGQSAPVGTPVANNPSVIVRDVGNNPVPGVQVTFAAATGGGSVTGGTAITDGSGIATVGSWILGTTAGTNNNTLTATADGVGIAGNPVTFTATATAGAPTQITISTQPSTTAQAGVALATQPVVQLRDAAGNISPTAGVTITASIAPDPGAPPSNATATTNGSGVATFAGLAINGTVGTYTISFASGSLTPATSGNVVISAGPVANLTFSVEPGADPINTPPTANQALTPAVVVSLTDAFGNAADATVHMALVSQDMFSNGVLDPSSTIDVASSGASATFSNLKVTALGNYRLTASVGSASVDSSPFTVAP